MKLIIDDADLNQIKSIYEYYPVDGVTTNPSILAKTGRPPYQVLEEIRTYLGSEAEPSCTGGGPGRSRYGGGCLSDCGAVGPRNLCEDTGHSGRIQGDETAVFRGDSRDGYCGLYADAGISGRKMRSGLYRALHQPDRQYGL